MRGWRKKTALGLLALATVAGLAGAEYSSGRAAPAARDGGADAEAEEGDFSRAVDPERFRKGNYEWDTQELIASGLTALHKENRKILQGLAEIKERIRRLEAKD